MVFALDKNLWFPPTQLADEDGLLAIGGDLSIDRLMLAYQFGIFPWYAEDEPICWYSPKERFVIFPSEIKKSKSMLQVIRSKKFRVVTNTCFEEVITQCANINRKNQEGTWINNEMIQSYIALNQQGIAHSVEVFENDELIGGLYGLKVNQVFCGESMFSKKSNASKLALIWLCENGGYNLIDCQLHNQHLESLGGRFISSKKFIEILGAK